MPRAQALAAVPAAVPGWAAALLYAPVAVAARNQPANVQEAPKSCIYARGQDAVILHLSRQFPGRGRGLRPRRTVLFCQAAQPCFETLWHQPRNGHCQKHLGQGGSVVAHLSKMAVLYQGCQRGRPSLHGCSAQWPQTGAAPRHRRPQTAPCACSAPRMSVRLAAN